VKQIYRDETIEGLKRLRELISSKFMNIPTNKISYIGLHRVQFINSTFNASLINPFGITIALKVSTVKTFI